MKQVKFTVPYSIKRLIPIVMLAGATILTGCEHDEPTPPNNTQQTPNTEQTTTPTDTPTNNDSGTQTTPEKPIEHKNVKLFFYGTDIESISPDTIKKYDAMSHIDTIYIMPGETFYDEHTPEYPTIVRELLQDRMSYSNKTHGKGDMKFCRGQAAALVTDSLWYIANGWTINQTDVMER